MTSAITHATIAAALLATTHVATAELGAVDFDATDSDTVTRFFHASSVLPGGLVMVSGGMTIAGLSLSSLTEISFYDPGAESFSTSFAPTGGGSVLTPVLGTGRSSHTQTTLLDGRVLLTGGNAGASGTNVGPATDLVELFDPVTGLVQAAPAMTTARAGHSATMLPDGRVLIVGGNRWQVFDPTDDQWSANTLLQRSRKNHAAILLADHAGPGLHRVLVVGGSGTGPDTIELIDPDGPSSALLSSTLAIGVDDLAATRLDDGMILIVGGQSLATGDTVTDTYLFDPTTDDLTPAPAPPGLPDGVSDHLLIGDGRYAFLFGGEQQVAGVDTELDASAVFDRAVGDWISSTAMTFVHDDFTAARLDDGRLLLVGGGVPFLGSTFPSASAELFSVTAVITADLDCSGAVDVQDLLQLLSAWGPCAAVCPPACTGDIDEDCDVGVTDLLALLAAWSI